MSIALAAKIKELEQRILVLELQLRQSEPKPVIPTAKRGRPRKEENGHRSGH